MIVKSCACVCVCDIVGVPSLVEFREYGACGQNTIRILPCVSVTSVSRSLAMRGSLVCVRTHMLETHTHKALC